MGFVKNEQELRVGKLSLGDSMVNFLDRLNARIAGFDSELSLDEQTPAPLIFVMGLPRSATTLSTQLLAANLNLGFISNVAAKFWEAPAAGILFSKAVLGDMRDTSYDSFYGKTENPAGLHEFSYFWHKLFHMEEMPPYDAPAKARAIDWQLVADSLHGISSAWGKPTVMKAFDVVYHLPKISEIIPRSLFVFVERDLKEISMSLAKGRIDYYGNLETWLSMYPPEYPELRHKPWHEQIAGQVCGLHKLHEDGFSRISDKRLIRIPYQDLCASPATLVEEVRARLRDHFNVRVDRIGSPPASFSYKTSSIDTDLEKKLLHSLEAQMLKLSMNSYPED